MESIQGDTVLLRQDPRDTQGFWFYWYFRVRGAAGRTLNFTFTGGDVLGVRGPAASMDGGRTWKWLETESMADKNVGVWHHIAMTWDGDRMTAYLDGKAAGEAAVKMAPAAGPMFIGKRGHGVTSFFNGLIDEVLIYNRPLSSEEIQGAMAGRNARKLHSICRLTKARQWARQVSQCNHGASRRSEVGDGNSAALSLTARTASSDRKRRGPEFGGWLDRSAWVKPYKVEYGGTGQTKQDGGRAFKGYLICNRSPLNPRSSERRRIQVRQEGLMFRYVSEMGMTFDSASRCRTWRNLRSSSTATRTTRTSRSVSLQKQEGRDVEVFVCALRPIPISRLFTCRHQLVR